MKPTHAILTKRRRLDLYAAKKDDDKQPNKKKYKFGDITKSFVTKITKKDDYEFGDLSRSLDKAAKEKVATLSNKDSYEFGDLARYVDSKVKEQVNEFTNKESYKFGDVTKEIVNKLKTREYTLDDMIILFKILLAFGAGLSPVASFLPAKLLIEMLDYSIVGDLGSKLIAAITTELDKRMKKAFTGDEDYQLGDLSKKAVLNYIGKEEYTFGDITRFVLDSVDENKENQKEQEGKSSPPGVLVTSERSKPAQGSILDNADTELITKELEEWDAMFLKDANPSTNSTSLKAEERVKPSE